MATNKPELPSAEALGICSEKGLEKYGLYFRQILCKIRQALPCTQTQTALYRLTTLGHAYKLNR